MEISCKIKLVLIFSSFVIAVTDEYALINLTAIMRQTRVERALHKIMEQTYRH